MFHVHVIDVEMVTYQIGIFHSHRTFSIDMLHRAQKPRQALKIVHVEYSVSTSCGLVAGEPLHVNTTYVGSY